MERPDDFEECDRNALEDIWRSIIPLYRQATLEYMDESDDRHQALESVPEDQFWGHHGALLAQLEAQVPGTAEKIQTRIKVIQCEQHSAERRKQKTFREKIKGYAYGASTIRFW